MLSGLWHQGHFIGQPFKNTVVRIPGPSSVDMRWISSTVPVVWIASMDSASVRLCKLVADARDNFILQFLTNGDKIGIVAGDAHEQMAIVLRVLLRFSQ